MSHETLLMNSLKRDAARDNAGGGIVPVLVRALSGQKAAYSQILSLARQQSAHVAAGESEALMVIFGARNKLIHDIAVFDHTKDRTVGSSTQRPLPVVGRFVCLTALGRQPCGGGKECIKGEVNDGPRS